MSHPPLHILLPVHNRRETTVRFAQALARQTLQDFSLVLIDDGSADATADAVRAILPKVIVIRGKGNWWWAGSLQQGYLWLKKNLAATTDSVVLIINDDVHIDPAYLEQGMRVLQSSPASIVGSSCFGEASGRLLEVGVHWDWEKLVCSPAMTADQVNCLSTRGLFFALVGFSADRRIFSAPVAALSERLRVYVAGAKDGFELGRRFSRGDSNR